MTEHITKSKKFKKEVEVILSPQAQMCLASTPYSEEEFIDWATNNITYGGGNIMVFLEKMHQKKIEEEVNHQRLKLVGLSREGREQLVD